LPSYLNPNLTDEPECTYPSNFIEGLRMNKVLDAYLRISLKIWALRQEPPAKGYEELLQLVWVLNWLRKRSGDSPQFLKNHSTSVELV
jgi:hypothetical protein